MNIPTNEKPYYKDGGSYYTEQDRKVIKEICEKTNDTTRRLF